MVDPPHKGSKILLKSDWVCQYVKGKFKTNLIFIQYFMVLRVHGLIEVT